MADKAGEDQRLLPREAQQRAQDPDCLGCKIVGSGTLFAVSLYTWSQGASLPPHHANRRFMFIFSGVFATAGFVRAAM
ncbi:Hypothetical protein NocV09_03800110 [Nannochloropsis oceanica]